MTVSDRHKRLGGAGDGPAPVEHERDRENTIVCARERGTGREKTGADTTLGEGIAPGTQEDERTTGQEGIREAPQRILNEVRGKLSSFPTRGRERMAGATCLYGNLTLKSGASKMEENVTKTKGPHTSTGLRRTDRTRVCTGKAPEETRSKAREEKRRGRAQTRSRTKSPKRQGARRATSQTRLHFETVQVKKETVEGYEQSREVDSGVVKEIGDQPGDCKGDKGGGGGSETVKDRDVKEASRKGLDEGEGDGKEKGREGERKALTIDKVTRSKSKGGQKRE